MSDTRQLEALRDALLADATHPDYRPAVCAVAISCDRAISALRAEQPHDDGCEKCGFVRRAEQPQACERFVCKYRRLPQEHDDPCATCGQPYSAHRQAAEQPAPPALTAVPKMPRLEARFASGRGGQMSAYNFVDVENLYAAATAIAQERDRIADLLSDRDAEVLDLRKERDAALKEAVAARRAQGEAEGKLAASEMAGVVQGWKERAEKAEAELAALKESIASLSHPVCKMLLKDVDAAKRELAALKAQHEAALREARASERERCAKVCDGIVTMRATYGPVTAEECRDAIRALGEEGGK